MLPWPGMSDALGPDPYLDAPLVGRWHEPQGRIGEARLLPAVWPITAIFILLPLWWLMGLSGFILQALALPMLAATLFRRKLAAPKGFALWLGFLVWCAFSATQITDPKQGFSLGYRVSLYLAATIAFVYFLNYSKTELPTSSVFLGLAGFFVVIVMGGIVGMVLPNVSFRTPVQSLLPPQLLRQEFISDLVSASTTSAKAFAAYPIHRPKVPFVYTNLWGATYAITLPFAIGALAYIRKKFWRDIMVLVLLGSVLPLVFSLDRGAWLSAAGGMGYAVFRQARGKNQQVLKVVMLAGLVLGMLLFVTPLGEIILVRLNNGYGDAHRAELYQTSIELVKQSPFFGYGAPVATEGNLSAGTHGQMWTVVVAQGIPGLTFFVGWLLWALWKASRRLPEGHPGDRNARLWAEVAIFTGIIQMPYYELAPWGLTLVMIGAALAWREAGVAPIAARRRGPDRANGSIARRSSNP